MRAEFSTRSLAPAEAQAKFIELVGSANTDPSITKTLHELVALGADPSPTYLYENVDGTAPGRGRNATEIAAKAYNFKALRFLKEIGVDLTIASEEKAGTPLHRAIAVAPESALMLIEMGAATDRVNARGETPLHMAVRWDRRELIAPLLRAGLNIEARTPTGMTPLNWGYVDLEICATLLDAGADVNAVDATGARVVHRLIDADANNQEKADPMPELRAGIGKILSLVIGRGVDLETPDGVGRIPREMLDKHSTFSQLPMFRAYMARRVAHQALVDMIGPEPSPPEGVRW